MSTITTKPLGDRVIIKEAPKEETKTKGGFILPPSQQQARIGQVIAIGPGTEDEPTEVPEGATVVFSQYAGNPITLEGEDYLLMKEKDIHAIVPTENA